VLILSWVLGRQFLTLSQQELLDQVEQSPVIQTLLSPLRWYVEVFISSQLWPDLVHWSALVLALNAGLLLMVFYLLDAPYLEVTAAASERMFARMQMMRSGLESLAPPRKGRVRRSLPSLPWWGGLGPIAWRQLTAASRNWGRLIFFVLYFLCMMIALLVSAKASDRVPVVPGLGVMVLVMTIFLPPGVSFDFRGDVDRMDILKSLPIRGFWLATGQLIAPVVLVSLIQWGVLGLVQVVTGHVEPFLLATAALALPFNFLLFALENLLFLWYPTRLNPLTPGDFQMIGRNMLLFLGRFVCLGFALVSATLVGAIVYLVTGRSWLAAVIAAWLVLAAYAAGMVPLVALAFRQYDVARDTPP
jgi:Putative ABC exporter